MNNRIKRTIPELPEKYEAYLYLWKIWIEELEKWKYYAGRRHKQYHVSDYWHSSDDKDFINDLARRKKIEFEILKYGTHEEMGMEETKLLKQVDGGRGAATSDDWYNKSNGGGLYSKGAASAVDIDALFDLVSPLLENYENYEVGETVNSIQKVFVPTVVLNKFLKDVQYLQTRNELYDNEHVTYLKEQTDEDANPDTFPPIIILQDAKIVDNKITHCKGSQVIIGGNHRTRGNTKSKRGIGLNALTLPHTLWKVLKGVDFWTFSNRFNPEPEKKSKGISPESAATWIVNYVKEKKFTKTSDDGKETVYDLTHSLVIREMKEYYRFGTSKRKKSLIEAQKLLDNEKLLLKQDNLISFSDAGLKSNPELEKEYEEKKKIFLTPDEDTGITEYDWIFKVSARVFSSGKIIDHIRHNEYKKKGRVDIFYDTLEAKHGVNGEPKEIDLFIKNYELDRTKGILSKEYIIHLEHLPVTKKEAKAQGYSLT